MTDEQRLQMITDQLILVRDNLFRGMSKSIQKLQARSINEVLELENFTQSPPQPQQEPDDLTIAYMAGLIRGKDLAPQRTWVGLTDEEALECWPGLAMYADCAKFWENIEAKLKAKNDN